MNYHSNIKIIIAEISQIKKFLYICVNVNAKNLLLNFNLTG